MDQAGRSEVGGREWDWRVAAMAIVGVYVGLVVVWMLGSDWLVAWLEPGPDLAQNLAFWRRVGFTVLTSVVMFALVARTLRARVRVERELRLTRERFELAIRGTNDGIWDWDVATGKIYWSARLEELLGFSEGGMDTDWNIWSERLHEGDRVGTLAKLNAHLERDEPYDVEYRLRLKDGKYRWFRARGKVIRDASGKAVRMAGSLTDIHERVEAQGRLRESEARYRETFNTNQAVKIVVDAESGRLVDANDAACRFYGYSRERLLSMTIFEINTAAREELTAKMDQLRRGSERFDFQHRLASGEVRDVEVYTGPFEYGGKRMFYSIIHDVTARRRAEEAARAAEMMFRSTFEQAAVGMSNVTLEGQWLMANDRLCQMLGRDRATLMGAKFVDVTHPEDVAENMRLLRKAVEGGGDTYALEKRYLRPDGTIVWGHVTASLVRDKAGKPLHLISVVQDISDRKRAEAELEESRRILEQAQKVGHIGSWFSDPGSEGRLEWSEETCRIFGIDKGEFDGRVETFFKMVHPEDLAAVREASRAALAGEKPYSIDHRIVRPDGAVRWVHEQAEAERDASGRVVRMVGVTQDITQRAEAERFGSGQRRVLEMMAAGAPLEKTIEEIVHLIEAQASPAIGSVLRLDERGRMWTLGAPSLPREFCAAMDGVEIGPDAGGCGAAMHTRRRVVVEDIAGHEVWAARRDLALGHQLRASWSEPILASDGTVLGSLAMYFREKRRPTENDLGVITTAAHLAGIAMERAKIEEARDRSETTSRALLDAIPDLMFRIDRSGVYLDYHAPDESRLLAPPEEFMHRRVADVLSPERAEMCMRSVEAMFTTGQPQSYEYDVRRSDGTRAWWEVRVVRAGEDEALLLLRDITDRRVAERRQRESEQRLRLLVENTPLGVIQWTSDFMVSAWNPGAERVFGYAAAEAMGRHVSFILPESVRRYADEAMRSLRANAGGFRTTNQNLRKDGTLIWCEWYNSPLVDATGHVFGVASVVEDVTERRLAQQRQDFMMAELDHRVKNNLAAVISLAEQTGRSSSGYKEFADKFMGRLRAMSRMHSVLARSRWQGADLLTLVTQTLEAFGSGSSGLATAEGPSLMLGPRAAQAMAMALNELATNAVKYGALSSAGGRVRVTWTIETKEPGPRRLYFTWDENGGPPVTPPARRGFGSDLIEGTIAYELRGTVRLRFDPGGVICEMVVPLTEEIEEVIGVRGQQGNEVAAKPVE